MNITKQAFVFFPATVLPEKNKQLLIRFKKARGTRTILTQGTYQHSSYSEGAYVRHKYLSKKWLTFNDLLIHRTCYKDGVLDRQVKNAYRIIEWAYIN